MDHLAELERSILIVDDDAAYADSLAELLQMRGYATTVFNTSEAIVDAVREPGDGCVCPPVALIDLHLGGSESGVDVIPRLRAEQPELLCVVMTTAIDSQNAIAALRRRAYDYFDKAWEPNALFAVLDRCFDRVTLQREHAAYDSMRRAKEKAEAASRAKSAFLATMSHELRTPLNAIIGFSEMMMHEVLGPLANQQYRTYVADIHDSGAHLLRIINDILDLSKAGDGNLELHEEVFDLRETICSVQALGTRLGDGKITVSAELPADLPLLRGDERKARQLLHHLVSNAIEFTPPGGRIDIVSRFDPNQGISLTVRDTGVGIAADDIARVLEPFEQVDSSLSRSHQGTGLGLPLVKAIADLHGGTLAVTSKVGVGTEVSVTFPLERAVLAPSPASSLSAA